MLISKFDLYKPEWLELVFDNRNKEYGAYDLRRHYADNMIRAMGITFFGIVLLIGAGMIFRTNQPVSVIQAPPKDPTILVNLTPVKQPVAPPKKAIEQPKPQAPVKTQQFIPPVVVPDPQVTTPAPVITQLTGAIGQTTTTGKEGGNAIPDDNTGNGTGTQPAPDVSVHLPFGLDVMPEPVGGEKAWAKFLNKNLRFPPAAQEDGVSGRVYLSFIIEKDGSLSNITVDRAAGHGFDEEALRVLKLAKAWKPGMQNGQLVRVKYEIPINFTISDSN
jgi:protein TonB